MEVYAPLSPGELFLDRPYSLASVVQWVTSSDPHWAGGVQYDADCTEVAVTAMTCISGAASSDMKEIQWSHVVRGARAFDVYTRADCSPAGSDWWDTAQRRVLRALAVSGPTQLERTFQTGASGVEPALVYPNLTSVGPIFDSQGDILLQPASTIISGNPLDIVEGLGRLEGAFGSCYDGRGIIHAPLKLGAALAARNLCYKEGNRLYTYAGNTVVLGDGYGDVGPGGTTPPGGSTWMYMTSPVFGLRGQPRTQAGKESFDRGVNTLQMIAEQKYLLAWECCLVAVLVTTGGEQAGEPNTPLQDT